MRKFESSHRRLEVLQTSRAQVVFLNHQLIMLLSNLGIPDDVFMNLQRNMLDKLAGESEGRKSGEKRKYHVVVLTSLSKTPRREGLVKKKVAPPLLVLIRLLCFISKECWLMNAWQLSR